MRFVPSWLLLILCMAIIVPAVSLAFYFSGVLQLLAVFVIVLFMFIAFVDVQISRDCLSNLELDHPDVLRCTKGREFDFPIQFQNNGKNLKWLRFGISIDANYRINSQFIRDIGEIERGKSTTTKVQMISLKRGNFQVDSVHTETGSVLGLWLMRKEFDVGIEMRSYPNLAIERKRLSSLFLLSGQNGSHAVRQIGKGREFEQLRDYQSGDDYTDVDWKATARRNQPVTRTYQMERTQEVYVVVDHSRFSGREIRIPVEKEDFEVEAYNGNLVGGEYEISTQLEKFLHCALVLASVAESQGDLFGFVSFADKVDRFIRGRNGKAHYNIIRDALYTLEPSPVAPDYQQLMVGLRKQLTRRALIIMLVDLSDPLTTEQFFEALPLISKQHLILVNMVRPEAAQALFTEGESPENTDDIYDKLAGHFQYQELKETAKKLSHLGVSLGVPEHEELCTEAVTQYLNVKKRQLI